jgi:hypothetical protein
VRVAFGCQVKIVQDNPPVIHHTLRLWMYKNVGLTMLILGVLVNITTRLGSLPQEKHIYNLFPFRIKGKCDKKIMLTKFGDPDHGILVQLAHDTLTALER